MIPVSAERPTISVRDAGHRLGIAHQNIVQYMQRGTLEGYRGEDKRGTWHIYEDSVASLMLERGIADPNTAMNELLPLLVQISETLGQVNETLGQVNERLSDIEIAIQRGAAPPPSPAAQVPADDMAVTAIDGILDLLSGAGRWAEKHAAIAERADGVTVSVEPTDPRAIAYSLPGAMLLWGSHMHEADRNSMNERIKAAVEEWWRKDHPSLLEPLPSLQMFSDMVDFDTLTQVLTLAKMLTREGA